MSAIAMGLAALILLALGVLYLLLREQGPNAAMVLVGRYTIWPFLLLAALPMLLVGLWLAPTRTLIGLAVAFWAGLTVCVIVGWDHHTARRAVRRISIRSRWPSVARSAGLGVTNDRRSKHWPGGVVTTSINAQIIEHLPRIYAGRAMPNGVGVAYKLRPAKGATIPDVGTQSTALAAALGVQRVVVPNPQRPSRGELKVLYRDPLTGGS